MKRGQCPIHNGTLETLSFFQVQKCIILIIPAIDMRTCYSCYREHTIENYRFSKLYQKRFQHNRRQRRNCKLSVQLYSDVTSVNSVLVSNTINNNSDNFRICNSKISKISKINAILFVLYFLFLHFYKDFCKTISDKRKNLILESSYFKSFRSSLQSHLSGFKNFIESF